MYNVTRNFWETLAIQIAVLFTL